MKRRHDEIERCRSMTAKPFGVNMTIFPTINPPDYAGFARAIWAWHLG
mgnify:CR=1 FL=1